MIAKGKQADIVVIDADSEYVYTREINKSKSCNTPFLNKTLKGRAYYTFKNGKLVFQI